MAYEFSFDGKSLWAFGGGSLVLCLLLFFAGVLLGVNWRAPEAAAAKAETEPVTRDVRPLASAREAAATPADASAAAWLPYSPAPRPQEPALYGQPEQQQPETARRQDGAQPYSAQGYAAQGYATQAPAPADYTAQQQRYAAPASREAEAAPSYNVAREAARLSGADAEPRLVSEAGDAGAQQQAQPDYSVQVGAYADELEARRLVSTLENRGYTPTLFRGRAYDGRQWFAVRIGSYASQRDATQAAQNFTRQERLQAAVRPSGSL